MSPPPKHTQLPHSPFPSHTIPTLGYGTCQTTTCTASTLTALRAGYTHLDTAQIYGNEAAVGAAIAEYLATTTTTTTPAVSRADLFVTSKLWETDPPWTREAALQAVRDSLRKLGLQYLDLYLVHTPRPGREARWQAWLGLQDAVQLGLVRAIGVSNWAGRHVEMLMREDGVTVKPCVNQLEVHPWRQQRGLREWCGREGVVVVAYSPLGQRRRLVEEGGVVEEVARRAGRSKAQVVLKWGVQRGLVVIPKSDKETRIEENRGVWEWELGEEDMKRLDDLDEGWEGATGEWDPEAWD
jgi:diketogulonate reductase-like aldo/keto reductase